MSFGKLLHENLLSPVCKFYETADGVVLPEKYKDFKNNIDYLEVYDTDIWICTFPKSGTTWTQEMIWLIGNNLNFEESKHNIDERFPFLENSLFVHSSNFVNYNLSVEARRCLGQHSIEMVKSMKSQRFIKTHLPLKLCPLQLRNGLKTPKIIYVARDPRDVCVSFFHHLQFSLGCKLTFKEFSDFFLAGKVPYGPFWDHLLSFWELRRQPNVLFLKYEDMKNDLEKVIQQTSFFLNKVLKDDEVEKLTNHLSFESMQNNPAVNRKKMFNLKKQLCNIQIETNFFRKGIIGDYKNVMDSETIDKFDKWIDKNTKGKNYFI